MKDKARFFIAGIFIGLSELLPGISGATVALMFGVYEKILNFLTKLKHINLVIPLLIGMTLSVFSFSKIINFIYQNHTYAFNLSIALLMIGYGLFLVTDSYFNKDINKGKKFFINLLFSVLIGLSLSGFYLSLIHI